MKNNIFEERLMEMNKQFEVKKIKVVVPKRDINELYYYTQDVIREESIRNVYENFMNKIRNRN